MDYGAERTVMGWDQAITYTRNYRVAWNLRPYPLVFSFGEHLSKSKVIMPVHTPVPGCRFMILCCHVVLRDVPLLLGLDVLRTFGLTIDFREFKRTSQNQPWSLPQTYAAGHAFFNPFLPRTAKSDPAVQGALPGTRHPHSPFHGGRDSTTASALLSPERTQLIRIDPPGRSAPRLPLGARDAAKINRGVRVLSTVLILTVSLSRVNLPGRHYIQP